MLAIVKKADGTYYTSFRGRRRDFSALGIEVVERDAQEFGQYCFRCQESEIEGLRANADNISQMFVSKIVDRLESWKETIASELDLKRVAVFITPGNDDPIEINETLKSFEGAGILCNLDGYCRLGRNSIITLDYTPPTPWHTPREAEESVLARMIRAKVSRLPDPGHGIFNFHCPPARTMIDLAPELDDNLRPVLSVDGQNRIHVGSEAVRTAIEEFQPVLGLHGHVHEAAGEESLGRTVCLNPGSEYWNGVLHAYLVDLDEDGSLTSCHPIEG
jgi:Icc-related predicted phosphoesterase